MAYFAELDQDNVVLRVIKINNSVCGEPDLSFPDTESVGRAFIKDVLKLDGTWMQTSFNASFRKNYAGIGCVWRPDLDGFVSSQPFDGWVLNEESCRWEPPVQYPNDGKHYTWNQESLNWVLVEEGDE
jgi:hypothetical protein